MAVSEFPFVTDGVHGDVPNGFFPASDSDKKVILQPYPGLLTHCTLTNCTEVRGLYAWGNVIYAVARRGATSPVWRVDTSGGFAEIGTISTSVSGPVWITNNLTQLCIVDGVTGYTYTPSTGLFEQITDLAFPGAGGVDYQDSYGLFFKPNSNQWFFSSPLDFRAFDAADFYYKESKPDNIAALVSYLREVWIFGSSSGTEVWYNYGGDNSSPQNPTFARNTGGVIPYGLGAVGTVLPENQYNPRTHMQWLTNQGQVVESVQYTTKSISNQMLDRAINGDARTPRMATFSDAIALEYKDQGHELWQITFPTADQTWVWDRTTKLWSKRQSYKIGGGYGRHRANCYTWLNPIHYVGDYENGKIYKMSPEYYDDDGHEIRRVVYSQEIMGGMTRLDFPSVQLVVEPGVGLVGGRDPQIALDFSSDGWQSSSYEVWQGAGLVGEGWRRAQWHQMGSGFRRQYRFTFTDPVFWQILGIDLGMQQ